MKRYKIRCHDCDPEIVQHDAGKWVRYTDVESLRAEKAEAEVTKLRADLDDALEALAAIHHYAGRVPKESIKAAVERVIPGLARKGEGEDNADDSNV